MLELDEYKVDLFTLAVEVIKVAEEQPDHRYINTDALDADNAGCAYSHEDNTGCIVGTAMRRLGKPLPTSREARLLSELDPDDRRVSLANGYVSNSTWRKTLTNESGRDEAEYERVYNWLMRVQSKQDDRASWSYAVQTASDEHWVAASILRNLATDAS